MLVEVLKAKIHKAKITGKQLHYHGSFGIDRDFMDMCGILPYEKLLIGNFSNGERFETYAIPAERGSRQFVLNGAVARLGEVGDEIVIIIFAQLDSTELEGYTPKVIELSDNNQTVTEIPYESL